MFESTLPVDTADLMRVSAFWRYLDETLPDPGASASSITAGSTPSTLGTRLSSLNPSLLEDLQRFDQGERRDGGLEPLEVIAAAVRHGRRLRLHLQHEGRVLPVTVFPAQRLVHCLLPQDQLFTLPLDGLAVLHVEPAPIGLPGENGSPATPEMARYFSALGPLMWELALRGAREELLPEIAGNAAYRIAPGADLTALQISGTLLSAVQRLQRETTNLRELSTWPGFDRPRAMRLLNALYLQAALMVSRTHPAATNEGWTPPGSADPSR
jgi:hypothetical protein